MLMEVARTQSPILLVEDEPEDVILVRYAFSRANVVNTLQVVEDGTEAVEYLTGAGRYGDRRKHPLPGLILLDLKLRRKDGFEVLRWVRQQPALRSTVVIILTSSQNPEDVDRAYELGVNSFVVKPQDNEGWVEFAKLLKGWWLGFNKFATMFQVHWDLRSAA